jgi:transcriptional regulator with XRE-family HTH domain
VFPIAEDAAIVYGGMKRVQVMDSGDLAEAVKKLRGAVGLTQERFAWKLGYTTRTIARWETPGTVIPPSNLTRLRGLALSLERLELVAIFEYHIRRRLDWIPDGIDGPQTQEEYLLVSELLKRHRAKGQRRQP